MHALVVGSRGQDGTLLCSFLKSQGNAATCLSREGGERPDGTEFGRVNIAEAESVVELIKSTSPDEPYYLAAFHHSSQQAVSGSVGSI